MVKLLIQDTKGKVTKIDMNQDSMTIGRADDNSIQLNEKNVSRKHARFEKRPDGELYVVDLSTYGTRINGIRMRENCRLGADDVVQIGDYGITATGLLGQLAAKSRSSEAETQKNLPPLPAGTSQDSQEAAGKDAARAALAKPASDETVEVLHLGAGKIGEQGNRGGGRKRVGSLHPMLVAVNTHLAGEEFWLSEPVLTVGRVDENDIQVSHHSISRTHAEIFCENGEVRLVDKQSKNGICVNGEYLSESILKSGDLVDLGEVKFRFVAAGEDFVYRPQDFAAFELAPNSSNKAKWLLIPLLIVLVVVAVALLVSGERQTVATVDIAAGAVAAAEGEAEGQEGLEPRAVEAGGTLPGGEGDDAPTLAAAEEDLAQSAKAKKLVQEAKKLQNDKHWEDAKAVLESALALDPEAEDGEKTLKQVQLELQIRDTIAKVRGLLEEGDDSEAWEELKLLDVAPVDSPYVPEIKELRKEVAEKRAEAEVKEGLALLGKKQYEEAFEKGKSALRYVPDDPAAERLIQRTKDAQSKALEEKRVAEARQERLAKRQAENQKKAVAATPKKAEAGSSDTSSLSAKELFDKAEAIQYEDQAGALRYYQAAANKGYGMAYRKIASIKITQGDKQGAIDAFKTYLKRFPNASNAEQIKTIIEQLGGTP